MSEDQRRAMALGGPLDGTDLGPAEPESYQVRMADDSVHLYVRTTEAVRSELVFRYAGRR